MENKEGTKFQMAILRLKVTFKVTGSLTLVSFEGYN